MSADPEAARPARAWTTRDYVPEDVDGILGLRQATFGDVDPARLLPDIWRWQFLDNPAGRGWVRLADHDGRVVGQYAAVPTTFRVGRAGERVLAMSCDTMTHPDYQRQGMFVALARELYAEIERLGVTTVWGFPNAASGPGFVGKLDWFQVHEFPTWVKPLRTKHVLQRWLRWRPLAAALGAVGDAAYRRIAPRPAEPVRAVIRAISTFDARFDELWVRHRDMAALVQVRDAAFLNWRFRAAPVFAYEPFEVVVDGRLEGYVVLRVLRLFDLPFGAVVDVFPCPIVDDVVMRDVLGFAERHVAARGAAFLTALLPPRHEHHLRRFGFLRVPRFANPRAWWLGCRCAPADEPFYRAIDNWYITYGDSDII
jgi:GNAT superfamily N-acetyltransferase